MPKKRDYTVGRGRPPVDTQFQSGKSGNPKGRPRGSKNLATIVNEELKRRVGVVENGKQKRITKGRAAVAQVANAAAKGDLKAFQALANAQKNFQAAEEPLSDRRDPVFDTADHLATIKNIVRRIRAMDPPEDPQAPTTETADALRETPKDATKKENDA